VETDTWVHLIKKVRKMAMENEYQDRKSRKSKAGSKRPGDSSGGSSKSEKTIEARMNPK
jgi:hypothetical protein